MPIPENTSAARSIAQLQQVVTVTDHDERDADDAAWLLSLDGDAGTWQGWMGDEGNLEPIENRTRAT